MRAVVFVNGVVKDPERLRRWVQPDDYLVAADGGALHCLAMGKLPHVVVGDLDSLTPELVAEIAARGAAVERHRPDKDQTDLELAIERALRDGATEIVLLGALGGRLDQSLANVLLLAQRDWPAALQLVADGELATVLHGGEELALSAAPGATVSLLPLSAEVAGITYTGLRYPLEDATLPLGSTRGVSNEVSSLPATVRIKAGLALVIQSVEGPAD
jgi:thiamine pyrophosphokinase